MIMAQKPQILSQGSNEQVPTGKGREVEVNDTAYDPMRAASRPTASSPNELISSKGAHHHDCRAHC